MSIEWLTTAPNPGALMSKTVDNGCTKAEAISADGMIKKLVNDYNITSEDWRWYFWG